MSQLFKKNLSINLLFDFLNKINCQKNEKYFMVDVFEHDSISIKYYLSKTNLCKDTNMLKPYYNRFYKVPVIYGFKSSKF